MDFQQKPNRSVSNSTILIVAIAISAIVGATTGAAGSVVFSRVFGENSFFSSSSLNSVDLEGKDVEPEVVRLIEQESATISVVEKVTPAVVSIVVRKEAKFLDSKNNTFFERFFELQPTEGENTTVQNSELVEIGGGTGFFVSSDGLIVTNRHVVNDEDAVYSVVTNDGHELEATVVARDAFLDIAILDVEGEDYPIASFGDSDALRIGQTVIAVGNTLSEYRNTVTKGVVSGINRRVVAGDLAGEEVIEHAIQTDAAINPGNSGGPLINLFGEVIGINTATSFQGEAISFALPINDVTRIVSDVQEFGRIVRPWLGVRYVMLNTQIAKEEGVELIKGALIYSGDQEGEEAVFSGSPADVAGLQDGDVVISINNKELTQSYSLAQAINQLRPGDQIKMVVQSGTNQFDTVATLNELNSDLLR